MDIKVEGNKLTVTCTLGDGVPSSSGKTLLVASTHGFVPVAGSDIRVSLLVIKPKQ